jgi:hypothetical protein
MTIVQVVITYRRFDYKEATPFQNIYSGSYIRYSPKLNEFYNGKVLFKDVKTINHKIHVSHPDRVFHRVEIHIIFHLLLQVPDDITITPRIYSTYPLILVVIPQLIKIYPTLLDFYQNTRPRTFQEVKRWIEGWKWWYLSRKCN